MTRLDRTFCFMSLFAMILLVIVLNLTTPSEIGPVGVLVFFTLVYLACFGLIGLLIRVFFTTKSRLRKIREQSNEKMSYYYGSVLAFVPIVLIFMRSLGEISLLEITLTMLFAVVGCFYISRRA